MKPDPAGRSRILLINAPTSVNRPRTAFLPLPLLILGTCLKQLRREGLDVDWSLVDLDLLLKQGQFSDDESFYEKAAAHLLSQEPRACLFTTHGVNLVVVIKLAAVIKQLRPSCRVVLGGVSATLQARDLVTHFPQIDVIIKGEGETALAKLIPACLGDGDFSSVPSAVFRRDGETVENPRVSMDSEASIPSPDYSLVSIGDYVEHNASHPYIYPGFTLVEPGRGCPYACSYCAPSKFWMRRVRYRPVDDIIGEMQYLAGQGMGFTFLTQDNLEDKFLREFSEALVDREIGIPWGCYARLDQLKDDVGALISTAGCRLMFIGLETPNRETQKYIRKAINCPSALERLQKFNSLGIRFIASFIAGFLSESREDLNRTLRFAIECAAGKPFADLESEIRQGGREGLLEPGANFALVHPLAFMPGTDTYMESADQLRLTEHPLHHDSFGSTLFGMNDVIREHWRHMGNPFMTHLSEEKVRFYYPVLRLFNLLNARPRILVSLMKPSEGGCAYEPVDVIEGLVRRVGVDECLTDGIEAFEQRVQRLLEDQVEGGRITDERVAA